MTIWSSIASRTSDRGPATGLRGLRGASGGGAAVAGGAPRSSGARTMKMRSPSRQGEGGPAGGARRPARVAVRGRP
eukprot:15432728-Alexandrium_andersonii.AAC.1